MKTKLLIISETLIDGVGKHIIDLITNLDKERFDVHVIHSKTRSDAAFYKCREELGSVVHFYEVIELHREIGFVDVKAFRRVCILVKRIRPDIVHCHSSKAGVLGRIAAKLYGVKKCFYTPHAYAIQNSHIGAGKKFVFTTIERILGRWFTTKTMNVSVGENIFAVEHGLTTKKSSLVIYNCIAKERKLTLTKEALRKQYGITEDEFVIGCVARLYEQKNPFEFLDIAEQLVKILPKARFLWVGDGEYRPLFLQAMKDIGLTNKVLLVGYQSNIDNYLNIFDLYLSTSLYEGLPYTIIEAMRSACPCVVSDVIGNNELVLEGFNGSRYPLGKAGEAVKLIKDLADNNEKRALFANNGYNMFLEKFTLEKMMKAYEGMYLDKENK